jgi:hypothetical protein
VKEACQEGARQAVKEAIIELFTNPELRTLFVKLQPEPVPGVPANLPVLEYVPELPPAPRKPNHWDRFKAKVAAIRNGVSDMVARVKSSVMGRLNAIRQLMAAMSIAAGEEIHFRRIILTALCVGTVVGLACWLLPDMVAACVSGVCAASTAVMVQIGAWVKRAVSRCGLIA